MTCTPHCAGVVYTHTIGEWKVSITIVSMRALPYGSGIYTYHRGVEGKHCYSEMVCIVSTRTESYGSGILYTYHRGMDGTHCYSEMVCIVSNRT